jgi:hypothetical protein
MNFIPTKNPDGAPAALRLTQPGGSSWCCLQGTLLEVRGFQGPAAISRAAGGAAAVSATAAEAKLCPASGTQADSEAAA